jgi:hypothetical protein
MSALPPLRRVTVCMQITWCSHFIAAVGERQQPDPSTPTCRGYPQSTFRNHAAMCAISCGQTLCGIG